MLRLCLLSNSRKGPRYEFSDSAVKELFLAFSWARMSYVQKWITSDDTSSLSENESAARVEAILFPKPLPEHAYAKGKDTRLFPNPHCYTPAEIATFLKDKVMREYISKHILMSVLLNGISIGGNPVQSLLPFSPGDMPSLDNLYTLIRGISLSSDVLTHIGEFGIYSATKPKAKGPDCEPEERKPYITLFESLLSPYFKTKSPADVTQRRLEFNTILDAAVELGVKVVEYPCQKIEYRWGERDDGSLLLLLFTL